MKKLFILLIISSLGFVACNDAASDENEQETTEVLEETAAPAEVAPQITPADTAGINSSDSADAATIKL